MRFVIRFLVTGALVLGSAASAAPVLMSADWARDACAAWNADAGLTLKLHESGWVASKMFGRLSFDGPMGEAMGSMGPFEGFLLLVGKVPGDTGTCPQ